MEADRGTPIVSCPVCAQPFKRMWFHLRKAKDPTHLKLKQQLASTALAAFSGDEPASVVALGLPFGTQEVLRLWAEEHGPKALRERAGRLHAVARPSCGRCGEPVKEVRRKFCSPGCAVRARTPEDHARAATALRGKPKSPKHRNRISEALRRQGARGEHSSQRPEVQEAIRASKIALGQSGWGPMQAAYMESTTPAQRIEAGRVLQQRTQEIYGVNHSYEIPGVADRANRAKSAAMSQRIAAGVPTNDWGRFRRGWHESPTAGRQWFQSGWEHERMVVLDTAGVDWSKAHGIRIPYRDQGGRLRYYVPDFLIHFEDRTWLEEVKGMRGLNFNLKTTAAEAHCLSRGWGFYLLDSLTLVRLPPSSKFFRVE